MSKSMLTQKQEDFCLNYIKTSNATASALVAGYKPRAAYKTGSENLSKPQIVARIKELRAMIASKNTIMPEQERQERLSSIGRGVLTDYIDKEGNIELEKNPGALAEVVIEDLHTGSKREAPPLLTRTKKVKLHNPVTAIQELNKMDGSYAPVRTDHTFNGEGLSEVLARLRGYNSKQLKEAEDPDDGNPIYEEG